MNDESTDDRMILEQLQRLVQALEISGRAILPSSHLDLLQSIVDAAARLFGAAAASIALVDETRRFLEFKVATGAGNEDIVGMRFPLEAGIAGYVFATGQPVAISDVHQDPRFNQEFAESTGYVPSSILATPLQWEDRVLGVMEVLDKIDAPSFGIQDMELLGLFANQASIAIFQSQLYDQLSEALLAGIKEIASEDPSAEYTDLFEALISKGEPDEQMEDLYLLADLFNTMSEFGDSERVACLKILSAFRDYLRSKPSLSRLRR
ncbi:MAG: GAF domain-containing protein [Anaerolineales bacterium]|nr:GAF domain-containing protein [Anaerolineales bacterium]